MRDDRYLGEIYHHGIKGMKWGVRRSPEQLGHAPKGKVAKSAEDVTIEGEFYRSGKGFSIHQDKLAKFCLQPGGKHSEQFFKLGYTADDSKRLFRDIEKGYDPSKRILDSTIDSGKVKFSIPMKLGVTSTRLFRTVWQEDGSEDRSRFITAYIDRRLKEDD